MAAAIRLRVAALRVLAPGLLAVAAAADAHVKWFVDFQVADPPKAPGEVLSPSSTRSGT